MDGTARNLTVEAFNTLVRTEQDRLFTLASLLLGDDRAAETAAYQACEAAWRLVERGPASFRDTLYASLIEVCAKVYRARQLTFLQSGSAPSGLCLDGLPFPRRAALALVEVGGFHYAEAARILGCSPQEIRSSVAAGRLTLARRLAAVSVR